MVAVGVPSRGRGREAKRWWAPRRRWLSPTTLTLRVPDVGNAGIIADDVLPGDILESRLAAWRKRMSAVAERVDLVRVIRRRRAAAMLPPATAMTWAHASPSTAGGFSVVKSLATAPPISRAIATPLGLDRAPRDGVCGCWEAVGKWPAGATVESLA